MRAYLLAGALVAAGGGGAGYLRNGKKSNLLLISGSSGPRVTADKKYLPNAETKTRTARSDAGTAAINFLFTWPCSSLTPT